MDMIYVITTLKLDLLLIYLSLLIIESKKQE